VEAQVWCVEQRPSCTISNNFLIVVGDLIQLTVFGRPTIVINSKRMANDMFSKKSSLYSSRPHLTMACDLVGWKDALVLLKYTDRFKSFRKMFHTVVGTRVNADKFRDTLEEEAALMARRLLDEPGFDGPVRKYVFIVRPLRTCEQSGLMDRAGRSAPSSSGYLTDTGQNLITTPWSALPIKRRITSTSFSPPAVSSSTSSPSSASSLNGSPVGAFTRSPARCGIL